MALVSVAGPLAVKAHDDFVVHMIGHLFLGMLAPLLMALAAPVTLLLRSLSIKNGRRLTVFLRKVPFRIITDPVVATILNVGGLWVLYTTSLFPTMHSNSLLHIFIHFHVFLAGYLFTISIIYIDPTTHRTSYLYRSITLVIALGAHGILSKHIYAHPPRGVPMDQGEKGAMLMYYGGDVVDILIIFLLCLQWYRGTRPKLAMITQNPSS